MPAKQNIYGYTGAAWQTLLVESNVLKNLRVKLYDGANGITSGVPIYGPVDISAVRGLDVRSFLYLYRTATTAYAWQPMSYVADAVAGHTSASVGLYAYNGATFDRLRSYNTGILKVGKGNIGAVPVRKTAVGQVVAGAHELHQLCVNPSAANAALELTDAVAGGAAVLMDMFFTARETHHYVFDPPIPFATGIYLETFTNLTSVLFCYV